MKAAETGDESPLEIKDFIEIQAMKGMLHI